MQAFSFLLGVAVMQLVYLSYYFIITWRREYLYFLLYSIFLSIFVANSVFASASPLSFLVSSDEVIPLGYSFPLIALAMYYQFVRRFTESKRKYPRFDRLTALVVWGLVGFSLLIFLVIALSSSSGWLLNIGRLIFIFNTIYQVILLIHLFRIRSKLNKYIFLSTLIATVGFKLTQFAKLLVSPMLIATSSNAAQFLVPMILGFLVLDYALILKYHTLDLAHRRMVLSRQEDLFVQRMAISDDLHDDIGSALSSLQVYYDVALMAMEKDPQSAIRHKLRMSTAIKSILENMNDVIWSLSQSRHMGATLSSRLKDAFVDSLSSRNILPIYDFDETLEKEITSVIVRKNLLMVAKEAINNSMKHSGCSEIVVSLTRVGNHLQLLIRDNGSGIPTITSRKGHGISAMERRGIQMKGRVLLTSYPGNGVTVMCTVPLTEISELPKSVT